MIFKVFKKYFGEKEFFYSYFNKMVDELGTGLSRLRFNENFDCFVGTISLDAGAEGPIMHNLGLIPAWRVIVRQTGDGLIIDGDTAWTDTQIYLKNLGADPVTATVLIFK